MSRSSCKHLTLATAIMKLEGLPDNYHAIHMVVPEYKVLEFIHQTGNKQLPRFIELLQNYRYAYTHPDIEAKFDEFASAT